MLAYGAYDEGADSGMSKVFFAFAYVRRIARKCARDVVLRHTHVAYLVRAPLVAHRPQLALRRRQRAIVTFTCTNIPLTRMDRVWGRGRGALFRCRLVLSSPAPCLLAAPPGTSTGSEECSAGAAPALPVVLAPPGEWASGGSVGTCPITGTRFRGNLLRGPRTPRGHKV